MTAVKMLAGLIIIVVLVSFTVMNGNEVTVSWYFGQSYKVSLWLALIVSFVAGALLVSLGLALPLFRIGWANRRLMAQNKKLQTDLAEISKAPLPEEPDIYLHNEDKKPASESRKTGRIEPLLISGK
jgi:uncharacterized integral membrane protein